MICAVTLKTDERLIQCSHKESLVNLVKLNHRVKVTKYRSVVTKFPNADLFVSAIHHFKQLMFLDLNEFWFISSRSDSAISV